MYAGIFFVFMIQNPLSFPPSPPRPPLSFNMGEPPEHGKNCVLDRLLACEDEDDFVIERDMYGPEEVNQQDADGRTPLHHAAELGWQNAIRMLARFGAKTSIVDAYGRSALHYAVLYGHVGAALELTKQMPALATRGDDDGWNPLHWAARFGQFDVTNAVLAQKKVTISFRETTKDGKTMQSIAGEYGRQKIR